MTASDRRRIQAVGEKRLISRVRGTVDRETKALEGLLIGIGDDAAVYRPDGDVVVTTDMLVEGVHFRFDLMSAADVGWRAVTANASDLAAMGSMPYAILLGLGCPSDLVLDDFDALIEGVVLSGVAHDMVLIGGDMTQARDVTLSITALGYVPSATGVMTRRDACVGDVIAVTGTLGGAAAGLAALENPSIMSMGVFADGCIERFRRPRARVAVGHAARTRGVKVAEDVSDGLAAEVQNVCEASGVGAIIYADRVPLHDGVDEIAVAAGRDPLSFALAGGEDFELVLIASRDVMSDLMTTSAIGDIAITEIGEVTHEGCYLERDGRTILLGGGYDHYGQPGG